MTSPMIAALRRLRPADLILPAGAILVSLGLQALDDRERRARTQLDELGTLVDEHLAALRDAGADVPDELAALEHHPLDPGMPWLSVPRLSEGSGAEPVAPARPRRRVWKLAAIVAAAAARGLWPIADDGQPAAVRADGSVAGRPGPEPDQDHVHSADCPCPEWLKNSSSSDSELVEDLADVAAAESAGEPVAECGWPGCEWTSDPGRTEQSQRIAAALHRNRCVFRPAGAQVSG